MDNKWRYGRKVQSPMPCIALWFIVFAMNHGLFVSRVSWAKEAIFVRVHVAVVLPWLFFRLVKMRKCVFKWKADEKFKAWVAADPTSKTKAMCVVCDKAIDISNMGPFHLISAPPPPIEVRGNPRGRGGSLNNDALYFMSHCTKDFDTFRLDRYSEIAQIPLTPKGYHYSVLSSYSFTSY